MSYLKENVNPIKRVGIDGVFFGLAGLLLGISLRLCPWEIPPLLLGLTQSKLNGNRTETNLDLSSNCSAVRDDHWCAGGGQAAEGDTWPQEPHVHQALQGQDPGGPPQMRWIQEVLHKWAGSRRSSTRDQDPGGPPHMKSARVSNRNTTQRELHTLD